MNADTFIIFAQPSVASKPPKPALHNPAFGQNDESTFWRFRDNFGRLGAFTVQDRDTGLRMMPFGSTRLLSQGVMNAVPGSIQTPIAKVGVKGKA